MSDKDLEGVVLSLTPPNSGPDQYCSIKASTLEYWKNIIVTQHEQIKNLTK